MPRLGRLCAVALICCLDKRIQGDGEASVAFAKNACFVALETRRLSFICAGIRGYVAVVVSRETHRISRVF